MGTVAVTEPDHPTKRKRASTTIEAKIERWLALCASLAEEIDQLPQFKGLFTEFQALLASVQASSSRLEALRAEADTVMSERNALVATGDELFSRLSLALRAVYGPQSHRLRAFGLKPLGKKRKRQSETTPVDSHTEQ
jgi:hypothetical protein